MLPFHKKTNDSREDETTILLETTQYPVQQTSESSSSNSSGKTKIIPADQTRSKEESSTLNTTIKPEPTSEESFLENTTEETGLENISKKMPPPESHPTTIGLDTMETSSDYTTIKLEHSTFSTESSMEQSVKSGETSKEVPGSTEENIETNGFETTIASSIELMAGTTTDELGITGMTKIDESDSDENPAQSKSDKNNESGNSNEVAENLLEKLARKSNETMGTNRTTSEPEIIKENGGTETSTTGVGKIKSSESIPGSELHLGFNTTTISSENSQEDVTTEPDLTSLTENLSTVSVEEMDLISTPENGTRTGDTLSTELATSQTITATDFEVVNSTENSNEVSSSKLSSSEKEKMSGELNGLTDLPDNDNQTSFETTKQVIETSESTVPGTESNTQSSITTTGTDTTESTQELTSTAKDKFGSKVQTSSADSTKPTTDSVDITTESTELATFSEGEMGLKIGQGGGTTMKPLTETSSSFTASTHTTDFEVTSGTEDSATISEGEMGLEIGPRAGKTGAAATETSITSSASATTDFDVTSGTEVSATVSEGEMGLEIGPGTGETKTSITDDKVTKPETETISTTSAVTTGYDVTSNIETSTTTSDSNSGDTKTNNSSNDNNSSESSETFLGETEEGGVETTAAGNEVTETTMNTFENTTTTYDSETIKTDAMMKPESSTHQTLPNITMVDVFGMSINIL